MAKDSDWETIVPADDTGWETIIPANQGRGSINPPVDAPLPNLKPAASPVAPARVPVAKASGSIDTSGDYLDPMGNVQGGAESFGTAPPPVSKSVLDKYKLEVEDRSKKPGFMVRPEYVEEVRNSFASVPAEKRRAALVEASKGSGSRALAAQRILADVADEEKAQQTEAFLNQPTIDALMKSKGGGQPPKRPPPKLGEKPAPPAKTFFPDVSPTFSDIIDQVPEGERIQNALKRDEITRGVITANTSLEATADAVDRASRDFSAEGFAKENPVLGALASGSARSVAGMANAVPLMMDFAIQMVDKDAQRVETPGFVQDIMRKANSYMPKEAKQTMSEAWTKGEFGSWLGLNLTAQSPQMANHFVAAMVPATRPFVLPVMGVQSAGVSFAQGDSSLASVLKGLAEVGGEKVTLGLFDKSMASLSRLPLSLQAPTVQAVGQKLAAAGVAITGQHIAGALEETTTQILQNGVDRFVEGKNVGLLDQVADAAVLGALMEGPLAIPQTAAAFKSGTSEFARAFEADVAGTTINRQANDALVRRSLDVQSYDANIISPTQTARVDRAQSLLSQATSVDEMTGAAEELAGNLNEMLVPENMVTPAPDPRQVRLNELLALPSDQITSADKNEMTALIAELRGAPSEPALTGELPPLVPGRIEPTMADEPAVNVETEQQFGLDKLRMNAPRPQSIQGKPAASLTDDELSATIADSNVSAITRRSAEVELKARQSEQAPNVPATTTTTTEAIPDVTGTLGSTPVRGGAVAPVSELPGADTARANAQQSLDRWSATQGVASPIQFNSAPPEETAAVTDIAQALNSQFGTRLFAYHDTNPDAPNGVAVGGTAFVNTANVAINVSRTSLHEFKHTIEQIARAEANAGLTNTPAQQFTTQIDSIFDDMTDAGKRAYVENFLHADELAGIADPAAREARVQELIAAPMTRSEMTADFLGSRATDKSFWADVARADPQGFKGFVDKWLGIIDGLLAKLRGRKDQGKYESLRVDKYVQDLNRAKMVARDALVAYRKGTLQQFAPPGEISGSSQNIPGIAASARPELGEIGGGEAPSYGTARQGAISVVGRHYSAAPRESLSGAYYGRGLKGAERDRLDSSPDPRLKNRIYFYVDQGEGVRPESGVGGYAHETKLDNIYDPQTRLIRPQPDFNAFESAVINAGFDGYIAPFGNNQSAVVLLGMKHKAVPVKQIGQPAAAPLPQAPAPTTLKKGLLSREANTIDVSKIPGAKLRMGSLEIPAEQTDAANAELERIGSDVRFAKKQQAEIAGPPVPKDFGVYKDVAKNLNLSDAEYNASALPLMTGQAGDRAFQTPRVGGLPEVVQWLDNRRQESGLPLLNIKSENDRETLANLMAAEAVAAIKSAGNAVEWYDETVAKTLRIMAVKYPELESDPAARNAFLMAVAISSQTMNVEDNLRYASKQYEAYRASVDAQGVGKFPEVGTGKSAPAMGNNFALANDVLAEMGPDLLRRFLQTEFTKRDLETMGFPIGGESMDEKMLGSAIFGPKIGFGFYSNLTGNFEPVTMDMWFMRTVGRLAGTLPAFDEKLFPKQVAKLRVALQQTGDVGKGLYAANFDPALVAEAMKTDEGAVALARQVNSLHNRQYIGERAKFDAGTRIKTDLVGAAASILKSADKPKDAPKSGGERQLLRDVVRRMVDKVEKETGKRVPPAALQALIWYPEQELYKKLGVKLRVTSQDYAGAAQSLLTKEGFDGKRISTAAKPGPGPTRQVAGKPVAGANQQAGQPSRPSGPLGGTERKTFIEDRTARVRSEEVRAQPLEDIFANLNKRGLARTKAEVAYTARPDGAQIKYVQENFLDILSELEDSDLVKINCD